MSKKIITAKIIHLAICVGLILGYYFFGNLNLLKDFIIPTIASNSIIYVLIPILAVLLSSFLYRFQLKKIDPTLELEEKFSTYQTASIMRWAILEGAAFLLLFLKPDFILFGILIIIYLLFIDPTEGQFKRDCNAL